MVIDGFAREKKLTIIQDGDSLESPELPGGLRSFGRKTSFWEIKKMQSHINFFILICLTVLTSAGFAQQAVVSAADANEGNVLSFPYIAEITADDVYIRSGPGTQYYHCGKLKKADKVKVVDSKYSWSRIVPPAGSFSWISKQFVSVEPNNPGVGLVTGNDVRVYAGAKHLKPIHSTTVQGKLSKGDKVRLIGEAKDDYYKIVPPAFAYLWVSTMYTKPLGTVDEFPLIDAAVAEPKAGSANSVAVVPAKISIESEKLKEYYALEKQLNAERDKPIPRQNYADIKKAFAALAGNKDAGKAARYSEFALEQIKRFELASAVEKEIRLQDARLQQIKDSIEKARLANLGKIKDLGRFAAVGEFQTSNIYGQEAELVHYRIIDDAGKTICYALPGDSVEGKDLSKFLGRKVGLVGTIEPHPQTAGALVRFTEIVEL